MATKKSSSKKKPSTTTLAQAAATGDMSAALLAVSTTASPSDSIFQCVVAAFAKEGLNHISSMTSKIVWPDIDDDVIVKLGDDVTSCLAAKGIDVPELAPAFANLKEGNKTTVVSDLVTAIGKF